MAKKTAKKFKIINAFRKQKVFRFIPLIILLLGVIVGVVLATQKQASKVDSEAKVCAKLNEVCNRAKCCDGLVAGYKATIGKRECRCIIPTPKLSKCNNDERKCSGRWLMECQNGVWERWAQCEGLFPVCREYKDKQSGKTLTECVRKFTNDPSPKPSSQPRPPKKPYKPYNKKPFWYWL